MKRAKIFLVLIPHRDSRDILRRYSESSFKDSLKGSCLFPAIAPLARLSRPMNKEELKTCARSLREIAGAKFTAKEAVFTPFLGEMGIFGLKISGKNIPGARAENQQDIPFSSVFCVNYVKKIFSVPVIGTCLLPKESNISALPCPPKVEFGAAALANMFWLTVYDKDGQKIGYEWKIGKLSWLPKKPFTKESFPKLAS